MKTNTLKIVIFLLIFSISVLVSAQTDTNETRVEAILQKMTLEDKIDFIGGQDFFYIRGFPNYGIPKMKMADGPIGVRNYGLSTTFAGGIALAATWNPLLAESVGTELGLDARSRGVHFLLGPGMNIYRAPMNARNFEYFGEDPFLASRLTVGYIKGVQAQGVSATAKHFIGNNSEFLRHDSDTIMDERTMREIYLPSFEAAVKEARVGAVMDSYNLLNGEHSTQNSYLNNEIAKKDWKFDGVMMSDWFATYDGVAAANGGMDLEMPSGAFMNRRNLLPAIESGKVSKTTIDDKVRRILRLAVRFGWLDRDQTDSSIPAFNQPGRRVALESSRESIVLLKNERNLLPLDKTKVKTIAVIGPDAFPAVPVGGGSARVEPFAAVSYLEGISNQAGENVKVLYSRGIPTLSELATATNFTQTETGTGKGLKAEYFKDNDLQVAAETRIEQHINYGASARSGDGFLPAQYTAFAFGTSSSRWTGFYTPEKAGEHVVFIQSTGEDGGLFRLFIDDKLVFDNWSFSQAIVDWKTLNLDAKPHKILLEQKGRSGWFGVRFKFGIAAHGSFVSPEAKKIAAGADAVVIAAGFDYESESEGADRTFALPPGQDELISEIAAVNKNTIVAVTSGGNVDSTKWLDRVPVLLEAWYPGQEGGTALAEILFGAVDPSGRLPATFERKWEDNPVSKNYYLIPDTKKIEYKEGVFVGYRGYEKNNVAPLFPFGFGLSYTTFKYGNLSVKPLTDGRFEISCEVTNTGKREGADVAQIYVGSLKNSKVARPVKELKGFEKVFLKAGETKKVSVTLDRRAFSYFDVGSKNWRAEAGDYDILIGRSSAEIVLRGKATLKSELTSER
jgi:beta-glucosidase